MLLLIMVLMMAVIPAVIIFFVARKKFRNSDILLAFIFFIACLYLGFSRDFAIFILSLFIFIGLFLLAFAVTIYKYKQNKSIRNLLTSMVLIVLAPIAAVISTQFYLYKAFYQWILFHPVQFMDAKAQEGFLQEIDSWSFEDMYTPLMLASSQHYNLTVLDDLKLWKAENGIVCDIAQVYKIYPKLYLIQPFEMMPAYTNEDCYKKSDLNK
ncbi:hypothetical protein [Commensalibacter communis]|uniref:hypothetical protein n=1 Tax=Commensalibacter communis TaxID=2972786 RepID=UPI0022FF5B9A|nr:hypothetical protein [Commensalibacter communis]CAI3933389.1 unnamed protein product [Commensalibacter communis]CAI3944808.1 unnamed protein product [Commensalibacter communis]